LFILNLDHYFLPIPDPGFKRAPDPDPQHCLFDADLDPDPGFKNDANSHYAILIFAGVKDLVNAADAKRKRHEKLYEQYRQRVFELNDQ
jgi:hypothetical protein